MSQEYWYREDDDRLWESINAEMDRRYSKLGISPVQLSYEATGTARIIAEDMRLHTSATVMDPRTLSLHQYSEISKKQNTQGHFSNFMPPSFPCHHQMVYEQRTYMKTDKNQHLCFVDFIDHIPSLNITRWARPKFDADSFSGPLGPYLVVSDHEFKLRDGVSDRSIPDGTRMLAGPELITWMSNVRAVKGEAADNLPSITVNTLSSNPNYSIARGHNDFLLVRRNVLLELVERHSVDPESGYPTKTDSIAFVETACGRYITVDQRNTPRGQAFTPNGYDGSAKKDVRISHSLAEALSGPIRSNRAAAKFLHQINATYETNHTLKTGLLGGLR